MQMQTSPEGFKKLCSIILFREEMPLVDPYAKIEPFWTIIMPSGHKPDMIKITLREWETTMSRKWPFNPKMKAVSR